MKTKNKKTVRINGIVVKENNETRRHSPEFRMLLVSKLAERRRFAAAFSLDEKVIREVTRWEKWLLSQSWETLKEICGNLSVERLNKRYGKGNRVTPEEKKIIAEQKQLRRELRAEREAEIARLAEKANTKRVRAKRTVRPQYSLNTVGQSWMRFMEDRYTAPSKA